MVKERVSRAEMSVRFKLSERKVKVSVSSRARARSSASLDS